MITHPEKVLFPDDGITKGELAAYYEAIAPIMLPHIQGRPVTMERFHRGIGEKGFFQKDVSKGFPAWLQRVEVPKKGGSSHHPLVYDARALLWLANQNSITPHVWTSRVPNLFQPDLCVFDLDPMEDEPEVLRAATLAVRDLLHELGLQSWVKTSGSKGFHIVVPLDGKLGFDEVWTFGNEVGKRFWCAATRSTSRRSSRRSIARGASTSTPAATATGRRSPRPTRCVRSRALRCPRPAPGTRWPAAMRARRRSPYAAWRAASPKSATCGPRCPAIARRRDRAIAADVARVSRWFRFADRFSPPRTLMNRLGSETRHATSWRAPRPPTSIGKFTMRQDALRQLAAFFVGASALASPRFARAAVVWTATFEKGDLSEWTPGINGTKGTRKNVEVLGEKVYSGKYAGKITVHPDDTFTFDQNRVDIQHPSTLTAEGKDSWLSGHYMMPEDAKVRNQIGFYESNKSFQNVMDFWVAPKTGGGTTINFGVGFSAPTTPHWTADFTAGVWHQIAIHVHWSTNAANGTVDVWFDGAQVVTSCKAQDQGRRQHALLSDGPSPQEHGRQLHRHDLPRRLHRGRHRGRREDRATDRAG